MNRPPKYTGFRFVDEQEFRSKTKLLAKKTLTYGNGHTVFQYSSAFNGDTRVLASEVPSLEERRFAFWNWSDGVQL